MAFNDTFRFGAHAIILNPNGQVLLLKKTYGDKGWSFPSGSVEPGETIHQALYRECLEELGAEVRDVVLTGFYYHSKYNSQAAIFRCSIPEEMEITLNYEHSEFRWMHLSELSETHRIRVLDALEFNGQVTSRAF
ncbi:NUDIX hydrolase [Paenibacillus harenae]|uniref:8-oxo-dGTP pyrophosphatase MutT (NUDIX family) n=1 Tax=Paenibacillus harenae TaxID=306543 RepID=A0ABT9U277_PAEHA|nr:NUDIX domain-containing protein [Paenibacillus harenae]MDQ0112559.1 8-oxo-dGTP pyrophosphatase MutT (NUDIX family) [Paenibacillus harenae]